MPKMATVSITILLKMVGLRVALTIGLKVLKKIHAFRQGDELFELT
jgi:hypothetical protein